MNNSNAIERIRKGLIYLLFVVSFYSHSFGLILTGILLAWAILESINSKKMLINLNDYVVILGVLILWCVITTVFIGNGNLDRLGKFVYYSPLLLVNWFRLSERDIKNISIIVISLLIIIFPLSIVLTKNFSIYTIGIFPLLRHHTLLGFYISSLSLLSLSISMLSAANSRQKWLWYGLALVLAFYVFLTGSRAFYIALVITGLMMTLYLNRKKTIYFIFSLSAIALLTALIFPDFVDRVKTIFDTQKFGSNTARLKMWKVGLGIITFNLKNFLFGVGMEGWKMLSPSIKTAIPESDFLLGFEHLHNIYIHWWVETGLIGLGLYLSFFFLVLRRLYKIFLQLPHQFSRAIVNGVFFSIVCYLIGGCFDTLYRPHILLTFYLFISLALSIKNDELQKDSR